MDDRAEAVAFLNKLLEQQDADAITLWDWLAGKPVADAKAIAAGKKIRNRFQNEHKPT